MLIKNCCDLPVIYIRMARFHYIFQAAQINVTERFEVIPLYTFRRTVTSLLLWKRPRN